MRTRLLTRIDGAEIWLLGLTPSAHTLIRQWATLSDTERERVAALATPSNRRTAVAARAGLREILAIYSGSSPRSLEIREVRGKKPWIEGGPHFNLSHSGELGLCAVSVGAHVGVDVEQVKAVGDADQLAAQFLGPDGLAAYVVDREGTPDERFLRHWTQREAYLKAIGVGLLGLDSAETPDRGRWRTHAFSPAPGYVGAVVVEQRMTPIRTGESAVNSSR